MSLTYKDSGVDIKAGDSFVKKIAPLAKATFTKQVLTDIGGFGGLFSAAFPECEEPVLVSGTDGVGTKLKIAQDMNLHDTIGIDLVAMCVNDIVTSGARPLFFLDYIACGKINESVLVDVIKGAAAGCSQCGCSLIGGETAEHPDLMKPDEYDLAGFAVGVVDKKKIIDGSKIREGDRIVGLASSGLHSNGYSLARRILFQLKKFPYDKKFSTLSDTLGRTLLSPTRIYVKSILGCLESGIAVKGLVHITGGGFYENIPRILPGNVSARVSKSAFEIPPVFGIIQKEGEIEDREMFTVFNMGIGMMLILSEGDALKAVDFFSSSGERASVIGRIEPLGKEKIVIVD